MGFWAATIIVLPLAAILAWRGTKIYCAGFHCRGIICTLFGLVVGWGDVALITFVARSL